MKEKIFWAILVIFAVVLLVVGLFTGDTFLWITALAIGLLVRYKGYDVLFKSYDEKVRAKRIEFDKKREEQERVMDLYIEKKKELKMKKKLAKQGSL